MQMPVITALDLVLIEKLKHLGALIALIDGRVVQKAVDGLSFRRLERRLQPQRLAREHLARVRSRSVLLVKPPARTADGVVAVGKSVVIENVEGHNIMLGKEFFHLRSRPPPVVVVALQKELFPRQRVDELKIGQRLLKRHPPRDVPRDDDDVVIVELREIFPNALDIVRPLRAEHVHGLVRAER